MITFKHLFATVPIACFTASLVWADAGAMPAQEQPAPAADTMVGPVAQSHSNFPLITVTEPVSGRDRRRFFGANLSDELAYDSTRIDQTVRWVGAQGNHWAVRIDDVIAMRDLRIAAPQETAMASLADDQVNDRLGTEIGSWQ